MSRKRMPIGYGMIQTEAMKANISLQAKAVFAYLCSITGSKEYCFPSQSKIAKDLNISTATVKRYIKELIDVELIEKEKLYKDSRQNNKYYICIIDRVTDELMVKTELSKVSDMNGGRVTGDTFHKNNNINNNNINNNNRSAKPTPTVPNYKELQETFIETASQIMNVNSKDFSDNIFGNKEYNIPKSMKDIKALSQIVKMVRSKEVLVNVLNWLKDDKFLRQRAFMPCFLTDSFKNAMLILKNKGGNTKISVEKLLQSEEGREKLSKMTLKEIGGFIPWVAINKYCPDYDVPDLWLKG